MFGFLNVDKAKHKTSRQVVTAVQKLCKPFKVGHAGTLDPLATGVLVVCVGPATRLTKHAQALPKTYLASFRLGLESDSEDIFGEITNLADPPLVSQADIEAVLPEFVGNIEQMPPKFSALKVNGKRAYQLARKGAEFELEPRKILIEDIQFHSLNYPDFQIEIQCGSGTYVRSLGRDIGRRLGSGAVMTALQRSSIGGFDVGQALHSDEISPETIQKHLVQPQDFVKTLDYVTVPDEQLQLFANGHPWVPQSPIQSQEVGALDASGRLLAVLNRRSPERYTPKTNFSHYWLDRSCKS